MLGYVVGMLMAWLACEGGLVDDSMSPEQQTVAGNDLIQGGGQLRGHRGVMGLRG